MLVLNDQNHKPQVNNSQFHCIVQMQVFHLL